MDNSSRELAVRALDTYAGLTAPAYTAIREQLVGALSVASATLEELQRLNEVGRANLAMIDTFTAALPSAGVWDAKGQPVWKLSTANPHQAKALQTSVLWLSAYSDSKTFVASGVPFYLIGRRPQPDSGGKHAELLLQPLRQGNQHKKAGTFALRTRVVLANEAATVEGMMHTAMFEEYTDDNIRDMFNTQVNGLVIDEETTGSVRFGPLPPPLFRSRDAENIAKNGLSHRKGGALYDQGISDAELAEFGTFDYLTRLAVVFDKQDVLRGLLQPQGAAGGEAPPTA